MAEKDTQFDSQAVASFLVDDYKLRTDYLTAHFSRMWTRFNFFLSIETGLIGVAFLASKDQWSRYAVVFALAGVLVSAAWYVFGAQDRYLVLLYRDQVKLAARRVIERFKAILGPEVYEEVFCDYRHAGDTAEEAEGISKDPFQWRSGFISITRLAAILPVAVLLLWGLTLLLLCIGLLE